MVIVKLMGGLGNQLFQYALGKNLAVLNNTKLKLDLSYFQENTERKYRLDKFLTKAEFATPDEVASAVEICEQNLSFDPYLLQRSGDIYLRGYWQSELYFKNIEHLLRTELVLKNEISLQSKVVFDQINRVSSVAIHVRRGDYVSNKVTNAYLGLCPLEYYQYAVRELRKDLTDLHFFIFTDDPEWVASVPFFQDLSAVIIRDNLEKEWEDLHLMSACNNFIIANSSFSWWGAWLAPKQDKIVYAPDKWFQNPDASSIDIIPARWRRL